MDARLTKVSKYLALRLRHDPGGIGLELDAEGWADVEELIRLAGLGGFVVSREEIDAVVAENSKQRYEFDASGTRLRARQGHSVAVDLGLSPLTPPELLYHGTHERVADRVREEGIRPMARQHVHLSADVETARVVGRRRGRPVVFTVLASHMAEEGHLFYRSANGVWLTGAVPPRYLR